MDWWIILTLVVGGMIVFVWIIDNLVPKDIGRTVDSNLLNASRVEEVNEGEFKVVPVIGEPTRSILKSLEEEWWDYKYDSDSIGYVLHKYHTFTHIWLGNKIYFTEEYQYLEGGRSEDGWKISSEDWMNREEKALVVKEFKAYKERLDKSRVEKAKQRQKNYHMAIANFNGGITNE